MMILGLPLLLLALVRFVGESATFEPYRVFSYTAAPPNGCVGTLIKLSIDREMRRPLFGQVTELTATTSWRQRPNNGTPGGQSFTAPFNGNYGREQVITKEERLTPNAPGDWYLHAELTVRGKVLLTKREQRFTFSSPDIFRVLPEGHPKCS